MKRSRLIRLAALLLALVLTLSLPVSALTVEQARELLAENYMDPVPESVLSQPTIEAMLQALGDPYTEYLDAREYEDFLNTMRDESIVGIGVTTASGQDTSEGLLLLDIYENSPAQAAGLQPGDRIVAVDHVSILGMDEDEAIAMIRGELDTQVIITYQREDRRGSVTITRAPVIIPATTGQVLDGNVGYISCTTWGLETPGYFRQLIEEMDSRVACWLIDLRGNGGGLTEMAANTAGLFCGYGELFYLRGRDTGSPDQDGYTYQFYSSPTASITGKPVIILVDGMTASSSEAFVATMRDHGRAVVVGSRTYGKGVAQGLWDRNSAPELFEDDCMKITIARFFSLLGNTTDTIGVVPDFLWDDSEAQLIAIGLASIYAADLENWEEKNQEFLDSLVEDAMFPDTEDSPYAWSIAALGAYNMVHGKGDGLFHPEDTLTRAELAQMLVNALNSWIPEDTGAYTDVSPDAWYADAVNAITAQGMMEGTGSGLFAPDAVLTHQELITVIGRLARWLNDDLDLEVRRSEEVQWDLHILDGYAPWAKPSAWLLSCCLENNTGRLVNLLWDAPEAIDPAAPATRGETADLLYSLFYYLGILP